MANTCQNTCQKYNTGRIKKGVRSFSKSINMSLIARMAFEAEDFNG
ncbi:7854_t:CDS:1, partial [Dentiscutata heterogama]